MKLRIELLKMKRQNKHIKKTMENDTEIKRQFSSQIRPMEKLAESHLVQSILVSFLT